MRQYRRSSSLATSASCTRLFVGGGESAARATVLQWIAFGELGLFRAELTLEILCERSSNLE